MSEEKALKNYGWVDVFRHAGEGAAAAFTSQKNFKIHFLISFFVLLIAFWLDLSIEKVVILIFGITFGLVVETLNTAFEKTVDLVTREYHPLAKTAKDLSAGAMLITSVGMAIIGLLILLPPLMIKIQQ